MKKKHKRLINFFIFFTLLIIAVFLILKSFNENLIYFYSPTQIEEKNNLSDILNKKIRVGGLVKNISETEENNKINFIITDNKNKINISYEGIVPPMFRESQGIVAEGKLINKNNFIAEKLVTKHDEEYMPPEVKKTIIEMGHPEDK